MDRLSSSMSAIDQKMAEMRIKNLEILKRHQEIEEDRQLAQQSSVTTITTTTPTTTTESMKDTTMRVTTKHRGGRNTTTQQNFQENQHERMHRPATRRKFENDWTDNQPQRAQRVDYNRLKRERAQEITNQQYNNNNNNISPELLEYAYPFHYKSETNHDADEPAHAKKLVIINNQANHIGSGRFNQQQQRTQEQGQRRREERMRRSGANNNGHPGGPSEFHLDVPPMSIWPNGSIPQSVHVQILPTNLNGHHTGVDHLMNNGADQLDQSAYVHNFVYPTSAQTSPFNGNGTVYFTHHPPPMTNNPHPSQATQPHFHQYHPTRTFENSNRHQFHHPSQFQTTPLFQHPPPPPSGPPTQLSTPSSSTYIHHQQQQQQEDASVDLPPRFRRPPKSDQENKYSRQRPISGDFEYLHNSSPRFNNENRFKARPQSFYDFSSQQQQQQSNNNFYRPSYNNNNNNNRYQRNNNNNNNNSLPLSAYMNVDESSYENENNNNNYWGTSYQRRRTNQPRTYHHDKHQFPLSSYDPRQYGFNNNYQRRNDFNNRTNFNRRNPNPNYNNQNQNNDSNDIDLIEEWWEDDNTELIGTNQSTISNTDTQITTTATIDDSGNSSLSTSMHLKESTLDDDDEDTNISNNDFINPSSDISTTDSNIIESLDQLQRQLKFEEDFEKQLASDSDLLLLSKESSAFDTAHFMQWAKEKFREELAGRLTAQEIEQHDAVVTDEDEDDDEDILNTSDVNLEKYRIDPTIDDDNGNVDELEGDLHEKLKIEENTTKTIAVE